MSGACDGRATPKMIRSTESTAWVDGNLAPGASVGVYCMHLAVQRAQDSGAALVAVKRTGHLGPGAWYTAQALESGMIGLMFSSSLRRTIVPSGYLSTGISFRALGFSFRIGDKTVREIIRETVDVLWKELKPLHTPVPTT